MSLAASPLPTAPSSAPPRRRPVDPDALRRLAELAQVVEPTTLAHERRLPVHPALAEMLPGVGLARGSTVCCTGGAAMSLALALAGGPTQAGAWAGVVGLPSAGLAAAAELGLDLARTIFVAMPPPSQWAVVLAALVDGVEVVVTGLPASAHPRDARRLQARLQRRGAVLLVVGDSDAVAPDLVLDTAVEGWEGLGVGHGHLTRRRVTVRVTGRRLGGPRHRSLWLPGASGGPEPLTSSTPSALLDP